MRDSNIFRSYRRRPVSRGSSANLSRPVPGPRPTPGGAAKRCVIPISSAHNGEGRYPGDHLQTLSKPVPGPRPTPGGAVFREVLHPIRSFRRGPVSSQLYAREGKDLVDARAKCLQIEIMLAQSAVTWTRRPLSGPSRLPPSSTALLRLAVGVLLRSKSGRPWLKAERTREKEGHTHHHTSDHHRSTPTHGVNAGLSRGF